MRKTKLSVLLFVPFLVLLGFLVYNLPPVKDRLSWRIDEWQARVKYALNPPGQAVFVPQQQDNYATPVASLVPSPLATSPIKKTADNPTASPSDDVTNVTSPPPVPTFTPTPLPQSVKLSGIRFEYQGWNNCGPATLGMALSYWGWKGDQYDIAAITKPNPRDKNVMPYELVDYVEVETPYNAITRVGGDIELLKRLLVAGLPVIIEKGFEGPKFEGWMGHYVLLTGYSDTDRRFSLQDSYYGPDQVMNYPDLESNWRAFNFTYLVVYPPERAADVTAILGSRADKTFSDQSAAQRASDEIYSLTGRDQFFAWFNRGTSLVALLDYAGGAEAYDQAFALYPSIPEKERPWRMVWYQTGPYWAYYYTGRYQDVIDLATKTLDNMSEPVLEESYYWRALAREAMGDLPAAIEDLQTSLKQHPGFQPSLEQLNRLGVRLDGDS